MILAPGQMLQMLDGEGGVAGGRGRKVGQREWLSRVWDKEAHSAGTNNRYFSTGVGEDSSC